MSWWKSHDLHPIRNQSCDYTILITVLHATMLIPSLGERGEGKTTFKPLHYKGTPIHRIVKGFIVQGGDFSVGKKA